MHHKQRRSFGPSTPSRRRSRRSLRSLWVTTRTMPLMFDCMVQLDFPKEILTLLQLLPRFGFPPPLSPCSIRVSPSDFTPLVAAVSTWFSPFSLRSALVQLGFPPLISLLSSLLY